MLLTKRKRSQNKQRMKPVKLELVANFCAFVRSDLGIRGIFVFVPFGWALVLRGTMSKIANGEEYKVTPTIENPKIFEYLEPVIKELMARK